MLGIGATGRQVDVIIGAAGLARVDAAGRVVGRWPPRCRLAGARLRDEPAAAVMHNRILHRHLQPAPLAAAGAVEQGADDAEGHQHAGAGVADRRARLDRAAVLFAGNAHRAAGGLRDRVERQPLLERAAVAKAFNLSIDDRRIDAADDIVAEPQTLNRSGREVLGEDVRLLDHLLDQCQAALVFEVDGQRALVGVVHHEIVGVAEAGAAGLAARRLHLSDVGTHPGERLSAGRAGLELCQVEDADALEQARRYGGYGHCRTPSSLARVGRFGFGPDPTIVDHLCRIAIKKSPLTDQNDTCVRGLRALYLTSAYARRDRGQTLDGAAHTDSGRRSPRRDLLGGDRIPKPALRCARTRGIFTRACRAAVNPIG